VNKLIEIFNRFGHKYLRKYEENMPKSHKKALLNFNDCRTETYGRIVLACENCGLVEEKNGACRNRACVKCNNSRTQEWIDTAKRRLPKTDYFHLVFTIPSELHYLARKNQAVFYDKLMKAVGETLVAFGASPRWVEGQIGFMTVLHTWDSKLGFFPHVHVMMMGGFLNQNGQYERIQRKVVFPNNCLAKRFKTILLKSLREELGEKIPSSFWKLAWVVYTKKNFASHYNVVEYLGRYIKRIGIGASRIVKVDKSGVVFKYRHRLNRKQSEMREMSISGEEFLRRYLQHILPKGFVRLRYYGLLHPYWSEELEQIRIENGEKIVEEKEAQETETKCEVCELPLVTITKIPPWFIRKGKRGRKFYNIKTRGPSNDKWMHHAAYNKVDQPDCARPSRLLQSQKSRR
jgi:hypothetical protein